MKLSDILNKKNELLYQMYFLIEIETENLECFFIDTNTNKCEDIVEFDDLINQKLKPLNTETSINIVFSLFEKELKNKLINLTQSEIIKGEDVTFHLTSTKEQESYINDPLYNQISSIDLDECEDVLKKTNNISESDSLIIFKVDINRSDSISTQIEYQIYNPYTLKKFNLSICENKQIFLYPPINLDQNNYNLANNLKEQGYDLFDSSDSFYNDICSPYNSINDTDVILIDRKNDFLNQNYSLCEEGCEYEGSNLETLKAKCKCNVKTEVKSINEVLFSKNKMIESFKIVKYSNIKVFICYKLVFDINRLKQNYGSYIMIFTGCVFIILMIIIFSQLNKTILIIIEEIINSFKYNMEKLSKKGNKKKKLKKKINQIMLYIQKRKKIIIAISV